MRRFTRITGFCLMLTFFAGLMSLPTAAATRLILNSGSRHQHVCDASTIAQIAEKCCPPATQST